MNQEQNWIERLERIPKRDILSALVKMGLLRGPELADLAERHNKNRQYQALVAQRDVLLERAIKLEKLGKQKHWDEWRDCHRKMAGLDHRMDTLFLFPSIVDME